MKFKPMYTYIYTSSLKQPSKCFWQCLQLENYILETVQFVKCHCKYPARESEKG